MKRALLFTSLFVCMLANGQSGTSAFVTSDIDNFWTAYDKIITSRDSATQYNYLNDFFLSKGTPGLKAIMTVRNYTAKSYIDAINNYPLFWNSIRANTYRASAMAKDIEQGVAGISKLYKARKPAGVYFTIGAFRTNGTTMDSLILIGSELAMADKNTITTEFPPQYGHFRPFFDSNPIDNIVFANVHEYIHTQQDTTIADNLLGQCVLEGAAEYVAVLATGTASTTPAIAYGKAHDARIKEQFTKELFSPFTNNWLYNSMDNEFKTRDLGYYVGYAICEQYYKKAKNKKQAVREMIELNYNDQKALAAFVDRSGYFPKQVRQLKIAYEKSRPVIIGIKEFRNNDQQVDPALKKITLIFSVPMDTNQRGFELGPLGEKYVLRVTRFIGWSADRKEVSFEVSMKPGQQYQMFPSERFRTEAGIPMIPYLINFRTAMSSGL